MCPSNLNCSAHFNQIPVQFIVQPSCENPSLAINSVHQDNNLDLTLTTKKFFNSPSADVSSEVALPSFQTNVIFRENALDNGGGSKY